MLLIASAVAPDSLATIFTAWLHQSTESSWAELSSVQSDLSTSRVNLTYCIRPVSNVTAAAHWPRLQCESENVAAPLRFWFQIAKLYHRTRMKKWTWLYMFWTYGYFGPKCWVSRQHLSAIIDGRIISIQHWWHLLPKVITWTNFVADFYR